MLFGSLLVLIVNLILSGIAIYFSAYFLKIRGNAFSKAFMAVLAGLAIGIVQEMLFPLTYFFSWIIALLAFLYALKLIYAIDWRQAFLLWIISIVLAIIIGTVVTPLIVAAFISLI